jgi:hypothetical protein
MTVLPQSADYFVVELAAPHTFTARAVPQRISGLNHETLDHAMKDHIVVVSIPRQRLHNTYKQK